MAGTKSDWLLQSVHRVSNWRRWDVVKGLRSWYYRRILARAGAGLRVVSGVRANHPAMVSVGAHRCLGDGVAPYRWNAPITIGSNGLITAGVRIITRKHGFADTERLIPEQGCANALVVIEDNVWIGFDAVIPPGLTIGEESTIGIGAVVTKDIAPHSIVGGVPACMIRKRTVELE